MRFALGCSAEGQTRRRVNHARAVPSKPSAIRVAQAQFRFTEIASEHLWLRESPPGSGARELQYFSHALFGRAGMFWADQNPNAATSGEQIAQQIPAEKSGGSCKQDSAAPTHAIPPWCEHRPRKTDRAAHRNAGAKKQNFSAGW
jgi:hypothetical protein